MKKIIRLLALSLSMILVFCSVPVVQASASVSGQEGEWYYYVENSEATIYPAVNKYGVCEIPSTIAGYPVTSIGDYAFSYHSGMQEVIIPEGIKHIGKEAFVNCEFKTITLPESLESIGAGAFYWCTNLVEFTIPKNVTDIGEGILGNCSSLERFTAPLISSSADIPIFEYYFRDGWDPSNVQHIGDSVPNTLKTVIINGNITEVCEGAFLGCTYIENILLPETIKVIGNEAFLRCTSLKEFVIPETVETIGNYAFSNCAFEEITIPKNVSYIGGGVFSGCENLKSINLSKENENYSFSGNCLIEKSTGTLLMGIGDYTIPDDGSVINIGDGVFTNSSITNITVPDGVQIIGSKAFYGCNQLKSVKLPDSVITLGSQAFLDCTSLTEVILPKGLKEISNGLFWNCYALEKIDIPETVEYIGDSAFIHCEALKSITIPEGVKLINYGTFEGCTELEEIRLPDKLESIEDYAFSGCPSLKTISISSDNEYFHVDGNCFIDTINKTVLRGFADSVIPADGSVTAIGDYAFEWVDPVTELIIPNSIESIGSCAFWEYKGERLVLPDSITKIGQAAFCLSHLKEIVLPKNLKQIPAEAFSSSAIKSIIIPESVEEIGWWAFSGSSIESINIPDNVKAIGYEAFWYCYALKSINIGSGLKTIEDRALSECENLEEINVDKDNEAFSSNQGVLYNKDKTTIIAFPLAKGGLYVIPDSVTELSYNVIQGALNLRSVFIPDNITYIDSDAFWMTNLKNVYYEGTEDQWNNIYYPNYWYNPLENVTKIFDCSEISPDFNYDGLIDANDVTVVRKALLNTADAYDVTLDGSFDIIDLVRLKKQVAGIK